MNNLKIRDASLICYPKVLNKIVREAKNEELKLVSKNINRAKELVYLMSAQFVKSYYLAIKKEDSIKINVNSTILKKSVCSNYNGALNFLLKKGVIYRNKSYRNNYYSREYWLSEEAIKKGLTTISLKDAYIVKRLEKRQEGLIQKAENNTIASYLLDIYNYTNLPSNKDLLAVGKQMVKEKKCNKKGKAYVIRGKQSKVKFLNKIDIRCIEDDIELFNSLTKNGVIVPRVGGYKSGGRVTCAIALTPSWIREYIRIENEKTTEIDFTTLHPNLANKLWGNNNGITTHDDVARELNMSRNEVKIKHLSFFNYDYYSFKNSCLAKYYQNEHNDMFNKILSIKNDDFRNGKKNSITYRLFKEEVRLMTRVIEEFIKHDIKALYVYDAMRVKDSDKDKAIEIMNKVAEELNVLSRAA